jgi:hypothetical protein
MAQSSDWPLSLALAAALIAVVLRLARARGLAEWTAVALFCVTVIASLAKWLGWPRFGGQQVPGCGGDWTARVVADVLLVGGLLVLARGRRKERLEPRARTAWIGRAIGGPAALLGYVLRQPTVFGIAAWVATTVVWVVAMGRSRPRQAAA